MTNKVAEFILSHYPAIVKEAVAKIKELALTDLKNTEKKAALDAYIINILNKAIEAWDAPGPDTIIDPRLEKLVAKYIPIIDQSIYDAIIDKLD
jgi:hypothetical protein